MLSYGCDLSTCSLAGNRCSMTFVDDMLTFAMVTSPIQELTMFLTPKASLGQTGFSISQTKGFRWESENLGVLTTRGARARTCVRVDQDRETAELCQQKKKTHGTARQLS